jgi:hypothetical protein
MFLFSYHQNVERSKRVATPVVILSTACKTAGPFHWGDDVPSNSETEAQRDTTA